MPLRVGQMNKKDRFDAGFFGIHRKHSTSLDVMTRLILERSYEAIVDAGKLLILGSFRNGSDLPGIQAQSNTSAHFILPTEVSAPLPSFR